MNRATDIPSLPSIPDGFPEFHPNRLLQFGGHFPTIWQKLTCGRKAAEGVDLQFPLQDGSGDVLVARLLSPLQSPNHAVAEAPLIVLVHGLGGEAGSCYMRSCARSLLKFGFRVLLVNSRGCGESARLCRRIHHPGRISDLQVLMEGLVQKEHRSLVDRGLFIAGMSLGGNLILRFLARFGLQYPIVGGMAVSAAIDLDAATAFLQQPVNWPYRLYLLTRMRREVNRSTTNLTDVERRLVNSAKTIRQFDDYFTAPRFGYEDAEDFYQKNSAAPALSEIRIPTGVLYALNDPLVPKELYVNYDWDSNPWLVPLLTRYGGHVGFQDRRDAVPWHHRCIAHFAQVCAKHPDTRGSFIASESVPLAVAAAGD